uniref:Uncharacterized protein n=1 Tax=Oryza barthii TaxID=65489 RepID=A0A0D3GJJ1_9ORYZ
MPTGYDATGKTWARGIALCARETADAACARERKPGGGQWARGVVLWERETEHGVAIRVCESEERGGAALSRFEGARPSDVAVCARETVGESECMEGAAAGSVSRELNFEAAIVIRESWLKRSRRYLINADMEEEWPYLLLSKEIDARHRAKRYLMEILALV